MVARFGRFASSPSAASFAALRLGAGAPPFLVKVLAVAVVTTADIRGVAVGRRATLVCRVNTATPPPSLLFPQAKVLDNLPAPHFLGQQQTVIPPSPGGEEFGGGPQVGARAPIHASYDDLCDSPPPPPPLPLLLLPSPCR